MPPLVLSDDEVQQLQGRAHFRSLPHSIVQRAQIVLTCGAGESNTAIAKRMGLTGITVGKWRKRYRELGLEGLHDELRPGRPRTYEDGKMAEVSNRYRDTNGVQIMAALRRLAKNAMRLIGSWSITEGVGTLSQYIRGLWELLGWREPNQTMSSTCLLIGPGVSRAIRWLCMGCEVLGWAVANRSGKLTPSCQMNSLVRLHTQQTIDCFSHV